MAYVCFKCLQSFRTIQLLWYHLKTLHNITTKSTTRIICGQLGCNQVYYKGYSYKRHLGRDHLNDAHQNELHVAIDTLNKERKMYFVYIVCSWRLYLFIVCYVF